MGAAMGIHVQNSVPGNQKSKLTGYGGCGYIIQPLVGIGVIASTTSTLTQFRTLERLTANHAKTRLLAGVAQGAFLETIGTSREVTAIDVPDLVSVSTGSSRISTRQLERAAVFVLSRLQRPPT
jgi:hypothetical protein